MCIRDSRGTGYYFARLCLCARVGGYDRQSAQSRAEVARVLRGEKYPRLGDDQEQDQGRCLRSSLQGHEEESDDPSCYYGNLAHGAPVVLLGEVCVNRIGVFAEPFKNSRRFSNEEEATAVFNAMIPAIRRCYRGMWNVSRSISSAGKTLRSATSRPDKISLMQRTALVHRASSRLSMLVRDGEEHSAKIELLQPITGRVTPLRAKALSAPTAR